MGQKQKETYPSSYKVEVVDDIGILCDLKAGKDGRVSSFRISELEVNGEVSLVSDSTYKFFIIALEGERDDLVITKELFLSRTEQYTNVLGSPDEGYLLYDERLGYLSAKTEGSKIVACYSIANAEIDGFDDLDLTNRLFGLSEHLERLLGVYGDNQRFDPISFQRPQ